MIIGIGIDIVDIRRIEAIYQKLEDHFLKKIFTQKEQDLFRSRGNDISTLAKIFASKEATLKAVSDTKGIAWKDMEIVHSITGRPELFITGTALLNIKRRCENFIAHLSISDEKHYATAIVIIESL